MTPLQIASAIMVAVAACVLLVGAFRHVNQ